MTPSSYKKISPTKCYYQEAVLVTDAARKLKWGEVYDIAFPLELTFLEMILNIGRLLYGIILALCL